jgi:hypothetical protein
MDYVTKIVPILWEVLGRDKHCAINVTNKETEIIVSIWSGRRWKRFKNHDTNALVSDLKQCYLIG